MPVTVDTVTRRDVPVLMRALGTVQAFQSVTVRARVDGTLDRILFTEGQTVKPGDVLAQLDPRPYQATLDQMLARKAADEAMLVSTRSDLVRYTELTSSQIASRQKLEQIRASVAQGEANLRGDDANVTAAQLNLGFTRIVAPIEGRVGLRQVDVGNLIRAADPSTNGIVNIVQIHPIALLFTLPQDNLPQVQAAMRRAKLSVAAFSADDDDRHHQAEGGVRQCRRPAMAGSVRQHADPTGGPQGRAHDAERRRPARTRRALRLRSQTRRDRDGSADPARAG
ncbi:MAG: hypothetical protein NVSMB18_27020 [Acetobacteraceae bacterium]